MVLVVRGGLWSSGRLVNEKKKTWDPFQSHARERPTALLYTTHRPILNDAWAATSVGPCSSTNVTTALQLLARGSLLQHQIISYPLYNSNTCHISARYPTLSTTPLDGWDSSDDSGNSCGSPFANATRFERPISFDLVYISRYIGIKEIAASGWPPLISTAACPCGGWLGGWTLRLTDLQKQIPSPTSNPSHPTTEMAHRQSGGYKEEPGVSVANDHAFLSGSHYRARVGYCYTTGHNFFLLHESSPNSQVAPIWQWRARACHRDEMGLGDGFDAFQKATTVFSGQPSLTNRADQWPAAALEMG
ncbi:hypothetical protein BKA65DRAFT_484473 [Rhexocercosporidium sp. MPI-PUGE-AT-0058]|nr:hypothetical protein BKA65DRAFT_484473 [Rhexocercosporidium sp. MPI-PUGE-AT-0058]